MPVPDEVAVPTDVVMQKLVAEQIGKVNGRASPGFDCVAAPFIKYATVLLRPRLTSWSAYRALNEFMCWSHTLAGSSRCFLIRPAYLEHVVGSMQSVPHCTKRGHFLIPIAIVCLLSVALCTLHVCKCSTLAYY
eukprot:1139661-Pelagomonas_calceolata.AAC.4